MHRCARHLRQTSVLVPVVRVTGVLPQLRTTKLEGALMSYHSFLVNGSTLRVTQHLHENISRRWAAMCGTGADEMRWYAVSGRGGKAHIFFPFPFFPLERRLFFPTAMTCRRHSWQGLNRRQAHGGEGFFPCGGLPWLVRPARLSPEPPARGGRTLPQPSHEATFLVQVP